MVPDELLPALFAVMFVGAGLLNIADFRKVMLCLAMVLVQVYTVGHTLYGQMYFIAGIIAPVLIAFFLLATTLRAWAVIYSIILIVCILVNIGGIMNYNHGYDDDRWIYQAGVIVTTLMEFLTMLVASSGKLDFYFHKQLGSGLLRSLLDRNNHKIVSVEN